jgi:signal transduction histidine kinase
LARLGEELVPHPSLGIIELVRNAYDADARKCSVELVDTDAAGGTVIVADTGDGMTLDDIRKGWLVLGRSRKRPEKRTRLGRLTVGDKGLGRLSALRLGTHVVLTSRPRSEKGVEYQLKIDWSKFDKVDVVDEVELDIWKARSSAKPGTTIEIHGLRTKLGKREVTRLARALVLLSDPFGKANGFRPTLSAPDFKELEKLVSESLLGEAEYRLVAELSQKGRATAKVYDSAGRIKWRTGDDDLKRTYEAPAARFEMWLFLLGTNKQKFSNRGVSVGTLQNWLRQFGGVHLYHRGLRVFPYGEPGYDWLDMNLRRVRDPELRPSTNNSVGIVHVLDPTQELLQKTDRSGFVENDVFHHLRKFATDSLDWMKGERLREREERRRKEKKEADRDRSSANKSAKRVIESLPPKARGEVQRVFENMERAHERERVALREDLQLYRTLSTVGTTVATFAHEAAKPASQISRTAKTLARRIGEIPEEHRARLSQPLATLERAGSALASYAQFPLALLKHDKRRATEVSVNKTVQNLVEIFLSLAAPGKTKIETQLNAQPDRVFATVAAIEAIVANLLNNAVAALTKTHGGQAQPRPPLVIVRSSASAGTCVISVLDSGPGIQGLRLADIWLPGKSTTPGGTGLGLTIVKDAAEELGGAAAANPQGELGGAEFIISLPIMGGDA